MTFKKLTKDSPATLLWQTAKEFNSLMLSHDWEPHKHYRRIDSVFYAPIEFSIQVRHIEKKVRREIKSFAEL